MNESTNHDGGRATGVSPNSNDPNMMPVRPVLVRPPGELRRILIVLAVAFTCGVLLTVIIAPLIPLSDRGGIAAGELAPEIQADGWVNGMPQPLEGNVSVIAAWATWCVPCRIEAEHLVKLHEQFAPRGVQFIGLTDEDEKYLPEIEKFLKGTGITWPNGYGATETMISLDVTYIPAVWVVDREGRIVWSMDSGDPLEDAIAATLGENE